MVKTFCLAWLLSWVLASGARGQGWQAHQVTNFANVQIRSVDSAIDSASNVHIFFTANIIADTLAEGTYYMRVSPQGDILTDTVALRGPLPDISPDYLTAVSDGRDRVWTVWKDNPPSQPAERLFYIAGRWSDGSEMVPATVLGGLGSGWAELIEAAYRPSDETLHWVVDGPYGRYYRISTDLDTLIWGLRVPENRIAVGAEMAVAPDGTPWGAWRFSLNQPADIVLARFDAESVATFYPFGYLTGDRWAPYDFAVDAQGQFHLLVYHDSTQLSYCLLDSLLTLLEWRTLVRPQSSAYAALALDTAGNCLIVWWRPRNGYAILRSADGTWGQPVALISPQAQFVSQISVHSPSPGRWVFTCKIGLVGQTHSQLWVYSCGYPPSAAGERPVNATPKVAVFPNPFNTITHFEFTLPTTQRVSLRLYDVLGREVAVLVNEIQTAGKHEMMFDASGLPSGVYLCRLEAGGMGQTRKIVLIK